MEAQSLGQGYPNCPLRALRADCQRHWALLSAADPLEGMDAYAILGGGWNWCDEVRPRAWPDVPENELVSLLLDSGRPVETLDPELDVPDGVDPIVVHRALHNGTQRFRYFGLPHTTRNCDALDSPRC
jgi:hypothetical protein